MEIPKRNGPMPREPERKFEPDKRRPARALYRPPATRSSPTELTEEPVHAPLNNNHPKSSKTESNFIQKDEKPIKSYPINSNKSFGSSGSENHNSKNNNRTRRKSSPRRQMDNYYYYEDDHSTNFYPNSKPVYNNNNPQQFKKKERTFSNSSSNNQGKKSFPHYEHHDQHRPPKENLAKLRNSNSTSHQKTEIKALPKNTQSPQSSFTQSTVDKENLKNSNTKNVNSDQVENKLRGGIILLNNGKSKEDLKQSTITSKPIVIAATTKHSNIQFKTQSSFSSDSPHISSSPPPSLNTPPKGGILRLDNESMKLLNQSLQKESDQQNMEDGNRNAKPNLDFDYALSLADRLSNFVHTASALDHTDSLIEPLRQKLIKFYEKVLLYDLNCARQKNALPMIWQYALYPFIDYYRAEFKKNPINVNSPTRADSKAKRNHDLIVSIITEGTKFFETLTHKMRSNYNFSYKSLIERRKHYDLNRSLFSHLQEITYNMKIIYIYLGDLSRYFQSVQARPNFEQAKDYYMKAHMLVPKNSHACSQIAIICYYQKNHFDAVYYFIRSFESESNQSDIFSSSASPTPFNDTVPGSSRNQHKQILTVIFDDICHCFDGTLALVKAKYQEKIKKENKNKLEAKIGHSRINKNYRIEYWVRPSGMISKWDMYNFYDLAAISSNQENATNLLHFYRDKILPTYSSRDLKKHFICSFLTVHGMLNSRSGLDRFYEVANQMLLEFDTILNHSSVEDSHSLTSVRLIQLLVINMYTISNTITEEDRSKNAAQYSFTHLNAYFIMSSMVIMILRRLTHLFEVFYRKHTQFIEDFHAMSHGGSHSWSRQHSKSFDKDDHREVFEEETNMEDLFGFSKRNHNKKTDSHETESEQHDWKEFYQLLPCVKIWADWVISSKPRFPPQDMCDLKTPYNENIWQVFAAFITQFDRIKSYPVNFYTETNDQLPLSLSIPKNVNNMKYEYELVQLPEDRCLEGFKLTTNAPESSKYIKLPFIPEIAYTYLRIASIQLFGDYLCGMNTPYLRYNTRKTQFESQIDCDDVEGYLGLKLHDVQEEAFNKSLRQFLKVQENLGISPDELIKDKGIPADDRCSEDEQEELDELNKLDISTSERRKLLEYQKLNKSNRKYFKIIKHMNEQKRRFIIQPRYIVLDTNCFLDDLDAIKEVLVKPTSFQLTIPLIVVQELNTLADRGQRISNKLAADSNIFPECDKDKIQDILGKGIRSAKVLEFLQDAFANHREAICALSSKGNIMNIIDYMEEFQDENAFNNDDFVLYSCTNLINKNLSPPVQNLMKLLEDAGETVAERDEFIHRDVILITNDLNLRLKSLCHDVPTKKLSQFLKWTRAIFQEQV